MATKDEVAGLTDEERVERLERQMERLEALAADITASVKRIWMSLGGPDAVDEIDAI